MQVLDELTQDQKNLLRLGMKIIFLNLGFLTFFSQTVFAGVALKDNLLFAFDKCKSLSIDVEKGQLKESPELAFDLHCKKIGEREFNCDYFEPSSNKKQKEEAFTGESDLGVAELKNSSGKRIKFLIGKNFASFESGLELKGCVGIYLFEQEALKKKSL